MSFLDRIFGSSQIREDWQQLNTIDDLEAAEQLSHAQPVVLFKHSVTCGVSARAKDRLEEVDVNSNGYHFYYLDLLAHRNVSNEISERYGVIHQSPQIILLKKGKAVFDTSHHAINATVIESQVALA